MRTPTTSRPPPARRRHRQYRQESVAALEPRRLLAAVSFDGGPAGTGTEWTVPANWSTDALPGVDDDVTIDLASNPTVRLASGNQSVRSVTIRDPFQLQGGSLAVAQASTIQSEFTFSNGTLAGAGGVTISGAFAWSSGTMDGGGTTTIANTATATFNTGGNKSLNSRTVNVAGTVNHAQGNLLFSAGAASTGTLVIQNGAVYNAQDEADLIHNFGGGINTVNLQPGGTFNKTGTGTTTIGGQVTFNNNGVALNIDDGTLEVDGTLISTKPIAVDAGATFLNDGTTGFNAGTTFPGPGLVHLRAGTHTFHTAASLPDVTLSGGTLTANAAISITGVFNWAAGTLTGAGAVSIAGPFTWSSGTMDGGGTTTIANTSTATFNTGGNKSLNNRTLNVAGAVNHTQGNLLFSAGAISTSTLNVQSGGVYNAQDEADLVQNFAGGTNAVNVMPGGAFNKTGTGTTSIGGQVAFSNAGNALNVDGGTLVFGGMLNNSTPLAVDAGATLITDGTTTFSAGTTFPGPGLVHLRAGAHTFNTAASLPNAMLSGGTVTANAALMFTGAFDWAAGTLTGAGAVSIAGPFTWSSGRMDGGGTTTIANTSTATFNTGGNKGLSARTLNVAGTVNHTQGSLLFSAGAVSTSTLNVQSGGVYNVQDEADLIQNFGGGTNAVNVQPGGRFNKTGTGNTQLGNQVTFNNTGTANVDSGVLTPVIIAQVSGNTLTAGTWNVGAGATLAFPAATAIRTNQANVSLTGANSTFNAINVLTTNNGTFKLAGGRDFTVTPNGGTLLNNGTLDLGPGSALSVVGVFSTGAGAAPTIVSTAAGTDVATQFGRVIASGDANLGGGTLTAVIAGPFDPPASTEFPVVTGQTRNGPFVAFNSATTTGGRLLGLRYDSANALITVRPIQPPTPDLADASDTGVSMTDDITMDTTPTLTGTADPSTTIRLYADGVQVGTVVATAAGTWSITASALAPGARVMTADSRDGFGNISPPSTGKTITIDTTIPNVAAVFIDSTAWTPAFRLFLQNNGMGSGTLGFTVGGGAGQLDEMPWANVNRVNVQFTEDVSVQQVDLAIRGLNLASYNLGPPANFTYNAVSRTASWILTANVANDKILLDLDAGAAPAAVADIAGNLLDGDWTNGTDAFPSGNGVPGGDFRFQINLLPGDLNRNGGVVNSIDVQQGRLRQFTSTTTPGTPPNLYTAFHDINGSGNINSIDVQLTRIRQFTSLPDGNPTLRGSSPSFGALVTTRVGRALAAEELESLIG